MCTWESFTMPSSLRSTWTVTPAISRTAATSARSFPSQVTSPSHQKVPQRPYSCQMCCQKFVSENFRQHMSLMSSPAEHGRTGLPLPSPWWSKVGASHAAIRSSVPRTEAHCVTVHDASFYRKSKGSLHVCFRQRQTRTRCHRPTPTRCQRPIEEIEDDEVG